MPCFEIMRGLLVSVFDKVSRPNSSRFTAQYLSCNLQNAIFKKSQNCAKQKGTSHIFFESNESETKWSVRVPNYSESL